MIWSIYYVSLSSTFGDGGFSYYYSSFGTLLFLLSWLYLLSFVYLIGDYFLSFWTLLLYTFGDTSLSDLILFSCSVDLGDVLFTYIGWFKSRSSSLTYSSSSSFRSIIFWDLDLFYRLFEKLSILWSWLRFFFFLFLFLLLLEPK